MASCTAATLKLASVASAQWSEWSGQSNEAPDSQIRWMRDGVRVTSQLDVG